MRISVYKCDYCNKMIEGEPIMAIDLGKIEDDLFTSSFKYKHYHSKCLERLLSNTQEIKQSHLRKDLDEDRIRALRDAGWTLEKIGDEFGVSSQTISNRLKKMEEEASVNESTRL